MLSTKSSNFEIFSDRTSSIQRNVKLKDRDSFFSFFLRSPCMKSVSYEKKNKSARRGAQFLPICMPTVCWKTTSTKNNKYVVNQTLDHFDDISLRERFSRIGVGLFTNQICTMYISVSINTCKRRDVLWSNSYVYLCIYNKYM